jgi:hypothetical protein
VGLPAPAAGWGGFSASFGGAGSVDDRSAWVIGLTGGVGPLRGFCSDAFPGGFFFESIFGVDSRADSFDTCAADGAFGFGVSAGGAESVEAGVDGAAAIGAPSGLTTCAATEAAAGFGASARGDESVDAGVDGAAAIGAPSGLTICAATDGAGGFGASTRCVKSVDAGVDGDAAIGSPSGLMICEGTETAAELSGASVNAGAADSKPDEARCGASTSAFP